MNFDANQLEEIYFLVMHVFMVMLDCNFFYFFVCKNIKKWKHEFTGTPPEAPDYLSILENTVRLNYKCFSIID